MKLRKPLLLLLCVCLATATRKAVSSATQDIGSYIKHGKYVGDVGTVSVVSLAGANSETFTSSFTQPFTSTEPLAIQHGMPTY